MMRVRPTSRDGRTVEIDTPYLKATIVDGVVEVWEVRDPAPLNLAVVNAHLAQCKQCPHAGDVTTTKRGHDVWTIRCKSKKCPSCAKVSLRHAGRCPEGRWYAAVRHFPEQ